MTCLGFSCFFFLASPFHSVVPSAWQLALVVVGSVFGALLLATLIALIVVSKKQ